VWQLELQVQPTDNNNSTVNGNDGITYRNSFLGLTGSWGTAVIGRHDTPLKISTGSLDLFGDTVADYNGNGADDEPVGAGDVGLFTVGPAALLGGQGLGFVDLRVDQAMAYISPSMNGLTIAAAIVQPGMDRATTAVGNADGFSEAYSIAALYSNGPFFASLAVEKLSEDLVEELIGNAALVGVLDGEDRWRLGLGYTANGFHVGLVYEDQDHAIDGVDAQRWQLSGSYTFGNNVVKLAYGENEIDVSNTTAAALAGLGVGLVGGGVVAATYGGTDIEQWSLGLDHNFSKNTKVYAVYTDVDVDHSQPTLAGTNEGDWDAFSVGMVHKF
jgi:predicted porin